MTSRRIVALSGGLSVPSTTRLLTDNLIEATRQAAHENNLTIEVDVIELRELALDVTKVMVTGMPEPRVEAALDSLENADGVIAVSPVYAGSYAGMFKTFVDLIGTERLAGTPVVLGATGGSARHSMALEYAMRPLFTALRAHSLPTGVFAASEDFGAAGFFDTSGSSLAARVERAGAELVAALMSASLPARHLWEPQMAPKPVSSDGSRGHLLPALAQEKQSAPHNGLDVETAESVGAPGPGSRAAALKSDGTKGRLRPDMDDFVPMTELFGQRS